MAGPNQHLTTDQLRWRIVADVWQRRAQFSDHEPGAVAHAQDAVGDMHGNALRPILARRIDIDELRGEVGIGH
jgi:hypothetical protein